MFVYFVFIFVLNQWLVDGNVFACERFVVGSMDIIARNESPTIELKALTKECIELSSGMFTRGTETMNRYFTRENETDNKDKLLLIASANVHIASIVKSTQAEIFSQASTEILIFDQTFDMANKASKGTFPISFRKRNYDREAYVEKILTDGCVAATELSRVSTAKAHRKYINIFREIKVSVNKFNIDFKEPELPDIVAHLLETSFYLDDEPLQPPITTMEKELWSEPQQNLLTMIANVSAQIKAAYKEMARRLKLWQHEDYENRLHSLAIIKNASDACLNRLTINIKKGVSLLDISGESIKMRRKLIIWHITQEYDYFSTIMLEIGRSTFFDFFDQNTKTVPTGRGDASSDQSND